MERRFESRPTATSSLPRGFELEERQGPGGEKEECWRRALASEDKATIRVDLTGLTCVDDAGKSYLTAMYHEGADFVVND